MKRFGILKPDTLVNLLNFVGLPAAILYTFCMLVWPWISGCGDWGYVQGVWDRWQSLNVGMLALVSSITAFNISRYNAAKQRQRDFLASKAFLPAALSELVSYFKASANIFKLGWKSECGSSPNFDVPDLPHEYKTVFAECIRHAEPSVGDYLSRILVELQIHDAHLKNCVEQHSGEERLPINPYFSSKCRNCKIVLSSGTASRRMPQKRRSDSISYSASSMPGSE